MKYTLFLFISVCCLPVLVIAQSGVLDESFGIEGKVITGNTSVKSYVLYTALLQRDSKILVAGETAIPGIDRFGIIRYLSSGSIDSSFNKTGEVETIFDNYNYQTINSIALQPDDKIIAAGSGFIRDDSFPDRRNYNILLARYMPDGTPDSSFGINGKVITDFRLYEYGNAIALQPDGKIIVGGKTATSSLGIYDFLLVRYLADGTLDNSFGDGGKVITDLKDANNDIINTILIQPDDKIIAGGGSTFVGGPLIGQFAIIRYNQDGSPDQSFGEGGKVITDYSKDGDILNSLAFQKDGKIIAAGVSGIKYGKGENMALCRYKINGSLDSTFGDNGKVTAEFEEGNSAAMSVIVDANNKIVTGGGIGGSYSVPLNASDNFGICRFLSNGSPDSSFGTNGKAITDFGLNDRIQTLLLQPDGKIVAAGQSLNSHDGPFNFALARYNGDPVDNPLITRINTWIHNNVLGWYTANNSNVNYYSIQRSSNGSRFTEEKRIQAANAPALIQQAQSHQQQTVSYILSAAPAGNYYRIAAIKKDGSAVYSNTVWYKGNEDLVKISPNPVQDILYINGLNASAAYELLIMNTAGNLLQKKTAKGSKTYSINVSQLKPGIYHLQVNVAENTTTYQIIKE